MPSLVKSAAFVSALSIVLAASVGGCGDDSADAVASAGGGGPGTGGAGVGGLGSGGSGGISNACADVTLEGDKVPVTMYIMFDKSGSMLFDQKWASASVALVAFFQNADSAGLNIALRFFPDDEPAVGCDTPACSATACAQPLVPAGELNHLPASQDPQQQLLVDAVNSRSPSGETPMHPALAGAEQWAIANADPMNRRTAVVLVTDGMPQGQCNNDPDAIAALAADALSQADVLTYAVGMAGANIADLDKIASAGGTDQAFVVSNSSVASDLIAALERVRTAELACSFPIPTSERAGQDVEPGEVNLKYTSGSGDAVTIPQVADSGACDADGGWYYDDNAMPTTMTLCPASCGAVNGDPNGSLEIVLGCRTVVK
jgi:hypothetical protein